MQPAQLDRQLRPIYGEHTATCSPLIISLEADAFPSAFPRRYRFRIEQNRDLSVQ